MLLRGSASTRLLILVICFVSLLGASPVRAADWNVPAGSWFDPANWNPMAIPGAMDVASVNNGGTASVNVPSPPSTEIMSLLLGTDGGNGTLAVGSDGFPVTLSGVFEVGVTSSGSIGSVGTYRGRGTFFEAGASVPFRVGVTSTQGDAMGTVRSNALVFLTGPIQFGVSSGAGDAIAEVDGQNLNFIGGLNGASIGVALDAGAAAANVRVSSGFDIAAGSSLRVGVSEGAGTAEGLVDGRVGSMFGVSLGQADIGLATMDGDATGSLTNADRVASSSSINVGVSLGGGSAIGTLSNATDTISNQVIFVGPTPTLNVGVASGAGSATGTVVTGLAYSADTANVGVSSGAGAAIGVLHCQRGISTVGTLNMGPGATLRFDARGTTRASVSTGFQYEVYSALDVTTANLDGTLILDFLFAPAMGQTYEIIRSNSMNGINGSFSDVQVLGVNQGYTVTSGVVLDGGVEKFVVTLTGSPVSPDWIDPATDDWFDASNWSSPLIPTQGDRTTITNGGTASASTATATGPMESFQVAVGRDGTSGTLTSDGVDLTAVRALAFGVVTDGHAAGDVATGVGTISNATVASHLGESIFDAADPNDVLAGIGVGVATGSASADGSLTVTDGSLLCNLEDIDAELKVGIAKATPAGSSPMADGFLDFDGAGIGSSRIEAGGIEFGSASTDSNAPPGSAANASAIVMIRDATVLDGSGTALVGGADCDQVSMGSTMVNFAAENISSPSGFRLGEYDADGGATVDGTVVASFVNSTIGKLQVGEDGCASDAGSQVMSNVEVMVQGTSVTDTTQRLEFADDVFTRSGGSSSCDVLATFVDSSITSDDLTANEVVSGDPNSNSFASANISFTNTPLTFEDEVALGDETISEDGSTAVSNLTVSFDNSPLVVASDLQVARLVESTNANNPSSSVEVGFEFSNGSNIAAGTLKVAENVRATGTGMAMVVVNGLVSDATISVGSDLVLGTAVSDETGVVDVNVDLQLTNVEATVGGATTVGGLSGTSVEPGNQVSAALQLNSGHLTTGSLTLSSSGRVVQGLGGLTRTAPGMVGMPDSYAAIDAGNATLDGDFTARFDFALPAGTHVFDLVVTQTTGTLVDNLITKNVMNLSPGFNVDTFEVTQVGGFDVLRLTVSGAPPPANDDCANAEVITDGTIGGSLLSASNDGFALCGLSGASPDVWYSYTATSAGTLFVNTCGTHDGPGIDLGIDTVLSVHSGCGPLGTELACNDDWNNGSDSMACDGSDSSAFRDSAVSLPVLAGEVVLIRVSNFEDGPTGPFTLNVNLVPDEVFRRGECNDDGTFNIADAVFVLSVLFPPMSGAPTVVCMDACDSNDDGSIDIADAVTALEALFPGPGGPVPLPAPGALSCGEDPTADMLDCSGYTSCP